jgi:hypothetical protein
MLESIENVPMGSYNRENDLLSVILMQGIDLPFKHARAPVLFSGLVHVPFPCLFLLHSYQKTIMRPSQLSSQRIRN